MGSKKSRIAEFLILVLESDELTSPSRVCTADQRCRIQGTILMKSSSGSLISMRSNVKLLSRSTKVLTAPRPLFDLRC